MHASLHFSAEVDAALDAGQPVVALESTLITHGLPWPDNAQTALAMEAAVRDGGAVPATIAVLGGKITVGLTREQLENLAQRPYASARKCSRRDLPIAVGRGEDAATTVAETMIVAHAAGIKVFATGGIGGVHRGAPFDVSADLLELGRTPVAVVCAGAKSILDLPLTLEVLETQGVPIIGLGTDTLPSFYSRSSGLPIDVRVETPREAAAIIAAAHRLAAQHGVLVTVPVPAGDEFPAEQAEAAIKQATAEAEAQGIHGKLVTPFLLKRVAELSGGASRRANTSLLVNNARVAAQIAVELAKA
ncbi:MAG TPA: pseudouridine-5'-phosphate glycosidase [Candidatus Didemnitutus sp.]|nr:pseudouridine-5'-phosphate glycosidase [Candidatus Didemnitutus sp.]